MQYASCLLPRMGMPGQKKRPFLPQNKFLFISACLASCKQAKKRPRLGAREPRDWWGCRAWEARLFCLSQIQPLGWRRLPSTPWTKCGESHFSLIRLAAWRKMIASRCTHVLMWKEFQLLCQLKCTISAQLQGAFQWSLIPCRCWEPAYVGTAELRHRRDSTPGVSRRARGQRHDQQAPLTAGNKAGVHKGPFSW